jgi:hypothetical protein
VSHPSTLPCPAWCTTDHARHDRFDRYVSADGFTVFDLRTHACTIITLPNPSCGEGKTVAVSVAITDDLTAGTRGPAEVTADGAELMAPSTAREVAAALLIAAGVAESNGATS